MAPNSSRNTMYMYAKLFFASMILKTKSIYTERQKKTYHFFRATPTKNPRYQN